MGSSCSIHKNDNVNDNDNVIDDSNGNDMKKYVSIATGYQMMPVQPHTPIKQSVVESNFNSILQAFKEHNVCMKCQIRNIICTPETIKIDMTMSYSTCTHCSNSSKIK
jgi:hypothetical protein